MQKISSTSRSTHRSVLWASAIAGSAALLSAAGCVSGDDPGASGATGAVAGAGATAGLGAGGLSGGSSGATGSGGSAATSGAGGTTGGTGGLGTGGALAGSGGAGGSSGSSGGTGGSVAGSGTSGSTSTGGTGGTAEPCVDVEPPPDPTWPDATCQNWANETTECSAAWFADYCDASCGRCTPQGTGGAGGTGNAGTGGTGPEPCIDVEPPPNAEWPDATCASWATETEECGAEWFAEYCDASCGRCTPQGTGGTNGAGGSSAGGTGGSGPVDCSGEGLPNVSGGDGFATRYWDCCQPHCAQFNGHRCGQDGVSQSGSNQSSCSGGQAYACYDEAPRAVSDCLSYGHIAKANPNCGSCYRIQFTGQGQHNANDPGSVAIRGKQMIVKVTNTGSDVGGNQFDLMVPGGGVGMFNACSQQWGTSDLGAQYGGFLTECSGTHQQKKDCVRQECMKIPSGRAREGCLWFVDWLQVADNPKFTSQQTDCPF